MAYLSVNETLERIHIYQKVNDAKTNFPWYFTTTTSSHHSTVMWALSIPHNYWNTSQPYVSYPSHTRN